MNITILKSYIIFTGIIIFASVFLNCSYLVDRIEAGITKRASFTIEGSYSPADNRVTISWEDTLVTEPDEAFAGYEIYATKQPDNEFIEYEVIIAPYDINQDIPAEELRDSTINQISFNPSLAGLNGVYFFRLGVIHWDKSSKEERDGTDDDDDETTGWMPDDSLGDTYGEYFVEYDPDSDEFDPDDENEPFYINKTNLHQISGSVMIDI